MTPDATDRSRRETIERKGRFDLSASILPNLGANLVSFTVDGTELLLCRADVLHHDEPFTGAFNMFPTPCRLAGGTYTFEGRQIVQRKNGKPRAIHGLIFDEPMQIQNRGDAVTSSLRIEPDHPVYEGFPYQCVFEITHALHEAGLTLSFKITNTDSGNLPFGYGVHPYWRLQGERKDVRVRVPCDHTLDLDNLVPTGGVTPVEGTEVDLRSGRDLTTLFIDNAFWKRNAGDSAELTLGSIGKRIVYEASENFPHMIVYAPEGGEFVCVENLTTCPNAPNLVEAGHGDMANMLVVPPGRTEEGWIKYTIEDITE